MKVLYSNHPEDVKKYTTDDLREKFLMDKVFVDDKITLAYSHVDRIIFGGIKPVKEELKLIAGNELRAKYFLERRELGLINIGGDGEIIVDNNVFEINKHDGLYIAMGSKDIVFKSKDPKNPAKYYINCCPAHKAYETMKIPYSDAIHRAIGDQKNINKRIINQYIHPEVVKSCQLCMGMTQLDEGNAWNTMPCHTHERRMEVYLYFDMNENARVFHFMGEPNETRHIVMKNEQAILSPSWSIHSGVGTSSYTFIWGMCGENQEFDDMDNVEMKILR